MSKGTIIKKHIGNTGGRTDKYEYTRRNKLAKAEMNLDKIFIAKFRNISIKKICKKLDICYQQGGSLNLNARDVHRIKVELDRLIREMYKIENYKGYDLSKSYSYQRWSKDRNEQIEKGDRILLSEDNYGEELTDE